MLRHAFYAATYWLPVLLILLIVLARVAAPFPYGASLRDNFLSADLLSMPLWHVALVRVKTGSCSAELTLARGNTQWHVISQRATCT